VTWPTCCAECSRSTSLNCGRCGGRLRFVAAIDDPDVVRRILGDEAAMRLDEHRRIDVGLPEARAPRKRPDRLLAAAAVDGGQFMATNMR
jgi:hypothetical protein